MHRVLRCGANVNIDGRCVRDLVHSEGRVTTYPLSMTRAATSSVHLVSADHLSKRRRGCLQISDEDGGLTLHGGGLMGMRMGCGWKI